ncbi:sensor histidine kinase [Salinigranum salinum]|uniref:sensor histidine kinase n=1 Tax=Salinigranum salinum TaxID=1364937 RepID=UPI0012607425|nr:PAS domain S-box protein [Salinigranum salinum]
MSTERSPILEAMLTETADAVVCLDGDGVVTVWEGAAEPLFGWAAADAVGEPLPTVPADEREAAPELTTTGADERSEPVTVTRLTASGATVPVELSVRSLAAWTAAEPTDVGETLCVYRDVTERERIEEEYLTYRRRLDGAMFAGDLAWWELDVETGAVSFHNNKADMLGYPPEAFDHYEDFTQHVHPDDHDRMMQAMRDRLEDRTEKYDVEYRIRRVDGSYIWFHDIGGITQRTTTGDPKKVTGIVIDVTRRKEQERRLHERAEQLAVLNRIVRHDINNEMNVVTGWLELLRDDLPPELQSRIDRVIETGQHVVELTNTVSDVMEVLEKGGEFELGAVSLRTVLSAELEKVDSTYPTAAIDGPETIPDVTIRANEMLSSVFQNLLNNAIQHNDTETPTVTVRVTTTAETVTVRIADNGPGIPPGRREALFGRGEKGLDSDGTGVGLYLVERLVSAYGGNVSVEDNEPEGAVFVVELERV